MRRAACSVRLCWNLFENPLELQNLATWFSYIAIWWNQFEGSWRFDALQWNSNATRESSRVIILKSRFFSTGHSACTSEISDIFWSSDLCTQWLFTADVLECSLTLRTLQFNNGARPYYYKFTYMYFKEFVMSYFIRNTLRKCMNSVSLAKKFISMSQSAWICIHKLKFCFISLYIIVFIWLLVSKDLEFLALDNLTETQKTLPTLFRDISNAI